MVLSLEDGVKDTETEGVAEDEVGVLAVDFNGPDLGLLDPATFDFLSVLVTERALGIFFIKLP